MRTTLPPAPAPRVVGECATVLFAASGVGRAAVDGDIWEIHYPRYVSLHAGQQVSVVGQRADVLLVLPTTPPSDPSPTCANAPTKPKKGGRRR